MKQHITVDQLNELSDKGKERLIAWAIDKFPKFSAKSYAFFTLSIGQMIEFLDWGDTQFYKISPNGQRVSSGWNGKHKNEWCVQNGDYENASVSFYGDELCDALWSACLEILNSKE